MTGPSIDPVTAMQSAGLSPSDIAQALAASSGGNSNDPLAFTGSYTYAPTGYPGAYSGPTSTPSAHPTEHGGGYSSTVTGGGGQTPYSGPISDTSSNLIFKFQEALLGGVAWAQQTKADMVAAGLIPSNASPADVIGAYSQMVKLSAGAVAKGVYKSPQDYIDQWKVMAQHDLNAAVTTTQTSTSRTVHNPADLAAAYQQTSTEALGRRATPGEARAGGAAGGRVATPTVSTTTTTTKGNRSSSNTVTREGASAQAINEAMLQHAMANPEYGAYQAAGRYFPVLEQALQAITGAGA